MFDFTSPGSCDAHSRRARPASHFRTRASFAPSKATCGAGIDAFNLVRIEIDPLAIEECPHPWREAHGVHKQQDCDTMGSKSIKRLSALFPWPGRIGRGARPTPAFTGCEEKPPSCHYFLALGATDLSHRAAARGADWRLASIQATDSARHSRQCINQLSAAYSAGDWSIVEL